MENVIIFIGAASASIRLEYTIGKKLLQYWIYDTREKYPVLCSIASDRGELMGRQATTQSCAGCIDRMLVKGDFFTALKVRFSKVTYSSYKVSYHWGFSCTFNSFLYLSKPNSLTLVLVHTFAYSADFLARLDDFYQYYFN